LRRLKSYRTNELLVASVKYYVVVTLRLSAIDLDIAHSRDIFFKYYVYFLIRFSEHEIFCRSVRFGTVRG
jgi:hypothetical protein